MLKSNVRFVAIWAAVMLVLGSAALLVGPLGIADWSAVQTGLVVASLNALSALVLSLVAYFWAHTTKEPAAVAGALGAVVLAGVALGNGFGWWNLTDSVGQLVVAFAGSILTLVLVVFVRANVTPVEPLPDGAQVIDPHPETIAP